MKLRRSLPMVLVLVLVTAIAMGVCNTCQPCPPPFDATGDYEGTWSDDTGPECPVSGTFAMNPAPVYPPLWTVHGAFSFSLDCVELPPGFPPSIDVAGDGLMDDKGNITFAALGCGTPYCVAAAIAGVGQDVDADGVMDEFDGRWSVTLLLPGIQPIGIDGPVLLSRGEEAPEALELP